jgi:hypothetical protein
MGRLALACWARAWYSGPWLMGHGTGEHGVRVDMGLTGRLGCWRDQVVQSIPPRPPAPRGQTAPQVTYRVPSPLHLSELCPPSLRTYLLPRQPGPVQDRQALVCALPVLPSTICHINPQLTPLLIPTVQTNFRTPVYACPFFSPSLVSTTHDPRHT